MIRKNLKNFYCDYCIGAKTGYTGEAKNCVVEFANKDGIELTAIVMGENAKVKGQKFYDAKKMFEYVFQNYDNIKVAEKDEKYKTIKINNGTKETKNLDIIYKDNVTVLKEKDNDSEIVENVEYSKVLAPIQKGETIGKIVYTYDGINYETELVANGDVEESRILTNLIKLLIVAVIIFIIYNLRKSNNKYGNHGKKYKNKKMKSKKTTIKNKKKTNRRR